MAPRGRSADEEEREEDVEARGVGRHASITLGSAGLHGRREIWTAGVEGREVGVGNDATELPLLLLVVVVTEIGRAHV